MDWRDISYPQNRRQTPCVSYSSGALRGRVSTVRVRTFGSPGSATNKGRTGSMILQLFCTSLSRHKAAWFSFSLINMSSRGSPKCLCLVSQLFLQEVNSTCVCTTLLKLNHAKNTGFIYSESLVRLTLSPLQRTMDLILPSVTKSSQKHRKTV